MSTATPFAVALLALVGGMGVALVEQAVAGARPSPVVVARSALGTLRQPLAVPQVKDAWLYHGAPVLLLVAAVLALATVPWAPGFRGIDLETGVLVYSAALAYVTPAVFMAGWGAGRPLAVVGGFRFVAQMLAYAMPADDGRDRRGHARGVAATDRDRRRPARGPDARGAAPGVRAVRAVGDGGRVHRAVRPAAGAQRAGVAASSAYTGVHAGMVAVAQKVLVLAAAGMTAALFLGGWHGPLLPAAVWMALKTLAVAALMLWAVAAAASRAVEAAGGGVEGRHPRGHPRHRLGRLGDARLLPMSELSTALVFWPGAVVMLVAGVFVFRTPSMTRAGLLLLAALAVEGLLFLALASQFLGVLQLLMMSAEMTVMVFFMVMFMADPGGLMGMDMTHDKRTSTSFAVAVGVGLAVLAVVTDWPAATLRPTRPTSARSASR